MPLAAVAALCALGNVLDGTAAGPLDRRLAALSGFAAPLVLLGAAARAPLVEGASPPALGVAAVVCCLGVFALQAFVAAASVNLRPLRAKRPLHRI